MNRVLVGVTALTVCIGLGFGFHYYHRAPSGPPADALEPPADYPLAAPPLRFNLVPWDFGPALPGKKMQHRFKIENTTAEPWTLKNVKSHCQCAAATPPPKTVKPGEAVWLEFTLTIPQRDGRAGGTVMVEYHPPGPVYQVPLTAEARSVLVARPLTLEFDYAPPGTSLSQTVQLHNRGDRRVEVARVETPEWLQAEVRPSIGTAGQARQTWDLIVRTNPDKLPPAAGAATLVVHTNSDQVGSAFIPVSRKPALEAAPSQLAFGVVESGKTKAMKVSLRTAPALGELTDKDLAVTHTLGDDLDVQVRQEKAPHLFTLLVQFQPKHPQGNAIPERVGGELTITTRKGKVPPARVTVSGVASRRR